MEDHCPIVAHCPLPVMGGRVAALGCSLPATVSCDNRPDQWHAYITYSENPERSEVIEGFKTYEQCRSAALARINAEGASETGYFECSYKCGLNRRYGMKLCKETKD